MFKIVSDFGMNQILMSKIEIMNMKENFNLWKLSLLMNI